jgi:hypothetical protein
MDLVPIPDHGQHEKQNSDQKEPGSFRGIDRVALVPMHVGLLGRWHAPIVVPEALK